MNTRRRGCPGRKGKNVSVCIGRVEHYNNGRTTIYNTYVKCSKEAAREIVAALRQPQPQAASQSAKVERPIASNTAVDENIRKEIIEYACKVRYHLAGEWKSRYEKMWNDILDLDVVSRDIYKVGKQQGTNFNRNLVANILCYMDSLGVFGNSYNAASMAMALEGSKESSIRAALRKAPSAEIVSRLNRYFEK